MHELSLALSLVEIAREEGARLGGQVSAVHVRLGALAGVVREALLSSYEMASADTPLAGSRLVIEDVPVVVFFDEMDALFRSAESSSCPTLRIGWGAPRAGPRRPTCDRAGNWSS